MEVLTAFTLLLLTTLYWTSAEVQDPVEVLYKAATFTLLPRSSVKLICQVYYDPVQCGQIHAVWSHMEPRPKFELTDPGKYTTVVNETIAENNWRRRQVLTEILDLSSEDEGLYQCQAETENKRSLMGHFITVVVKG